MSTQNPFAKYNKEELDSINRQLDTAIASGKLNPAQIDGAQKAKEQVGQMLVQFPEPKPLLPVDPRAQFAKAVAEFGKGAAKGLGSTAVNTMGMILGPPPPAGQPALESLRASVTPQGTAQKLGFGTEQTAEYFAPFGGDAKILKLIERSPEAWRNLARWGYDAVKAGIVGTAQSGRPVEGLKTGATVGGMSMLGSVLGSLMSKVGNKIQLQTIRPRLVDWQDGFRPETLQKLGLRGNLDAAFAQVTQKLDELRTARNALLDPKTAKQIDLKQIFDLSEAELKAQVSSLKMAGTSQSVMKAFNDLRQDVERSLRIKKGQPIPVDITKAENAKEAYGLLGAWAYGRRELDAQAKEQAANVIYSHLRQAIEQAVPATGQVAIYNAAMKEIIPVRNAMLVRIPVEERNKLFSLADVTALIPAIVSGDARTLGLLALTRGQKSLRTGNWLAGNAEGAQNALTGMGRLVAPQMIDREPQR